MIDLKILCTLSYKAFNLGSRATLYFDCCAAIERVTKLSRGTFGDTRLLPLDYLATEASHSAKSCLWAVAQLLSNISENVAQPTVVG